MGTFIFLSEKQTTFFLLYKYNFIVSELMSLTVKIEALPLFYYVSFFFLTWKTRTQKKRNILDLNNFIKVR